MKAVITGGEGGLGRAMRARLEREGYEVESLDLVNGFDVTDPAAWERVDSVDLAVLNAGILTAEIDLRKLTTEDYRRAVAVNVDGVVFGVRRLAQVMDGGTIIATASLAGLLPMAGDALYTMTKHAVVGYMRAVGQSLAEEGIRACAVCPGFVDTPLIADHRDQFGDFPMLVPDDVADAIEGILERGKSGEAWFVQPGREPGPYGFRGVPGPAGGTPPPALKLDH